MCLAAGDEKLLSLGTGRRLEAVEIHPVGQPSAISSTVPGKLVTPRGQIPVHQIRDLTPQDIEHAKPDRAISIQGELY